LVTPLRLQFTAVAPLLLLPLLAGCQGQTAREEPAVPFVFRSLNLKQQDPQGRPAWQLTSPEAHYDLSRKVAQARDLRGTIFSAGKPLYRLSATTGTVLNDGALIQLEGLATLERLGPQPVVVKARRVRWFPRQQRMELDQRPTASDRDLTVTADRALFLIDQDKLELRGRPEFSRRTPGRPPEIVLRVSSADWFPTTGLLSAPGPVRAVRRQEGGKAPQLLESPFLRGNTLQQRLVLQAPVRFTDRASKAWLSGGDTAIELTRQAVVSAQPFRGQIDQLQLSGQGFELLSGQTQAVIQPGCELRQPGEILTARRCSWNWVTQAVEASGGVILRRQQNNQITRARRLDGRLGKDGLAEFSSPGSRVNTQVRVSSGKGGGNAPRREAAEAGQTQPPRRPIAL
jgi:hypothetical protein